MLHLLLLLAGCTCGRPQAPELQAAVVAEQVFAPAPARDRSQGASSVLIFLIDTLRADHLGSYGYPAPTSPYLDRLAASGIRYSHAVAPSPWTYPSTASLWTGLTPAAHGAIMPLDGTPDASANKGGAGAIELHPAFTTLAEVMQRAGFRTGLFMANPWLKLGNEQGFDRVHKRTRPLHQRIKAPIHWLQALPPEERFLLVVHSMDVHTASKSKPRHRAIFPAVATLDDDDYAFASRFRRFKLAKQRGWSRRQHRARRIGTYDAAIRSVDEELPRLIQAALAHDPDTLVVVVADHGEELYDHLAWQKSRYLLPARSYHQGHGYSFFDELVRVPLIFWMTGLTPRVVAQPVSLIDVMPTVLEATGVPSELPLEGRSLWSTDPAPRPIVSDAVAFGIGKQAILDWPYKYVRSDHGEPPSLMRLDTDPGETTDLMASESSTAARLDALLSAKLAASARLGREILGGQQRQVHARTDDEQAELEALGYVEAVP